MDSVLLFGDGPLRIQGYATLFGVSASMEHGTETIRPGAFAASLKPGARDIVATWAHDHFFTWARTTDRTLRLWETKTGLAFEANIESSLRGAGLMDYVAAGAGACSITYVATDCVATATGREVLRANLEEICISTEGAMPTACWLAEDAQPPGSLTPRGEELRRRWTLEQPTQRTHMPSAAARAHRITAQSALTDDEDWLIPPVGFSREEWKAFGFREAAGRRAMRPPRRAR